MKTLEDLQAELLKTSLDEDCLYLKNDKLIIEELANNGNFEIYTYEVCGETYFGIDYNIYKGQTTQLYEDIVDLQLIYNWIIATMKMNGMRIK
jgi:hypothetical protein